MCNEGRATERGEGEEEGERGGGDDRADRNRRGNRLKVGAVLSTLGMVVDRRGVRKGAKWGLWLFR